MTVKALLIDDEPLALAQLERYAVRVPFLEVLDSCLSAEEALPLIPEADVLFTDISMPDRSGMDLVRSLGEKAPLVVFTTAYAEYAVEGFRVNAVDYLLKPFSQADFTQAAQKVRDLLMLRRSAAAPELLVFRAAQRTISVPVGAIRYIAAMSEYVKVLRSDGNEPVVALYRLSRLEEELPPSLFMRIHRSYIVALASVREASRSRVVLDDGTALPVSGQYRPAVEERLLSGR